MKMPGKCTWPKYLSILGEKWEKEYLGVGQARRVDRQGGIE